MVKTLTNEEYNVLNKIATKTKTDCWFALEQDSDGSDFVYDLEEGKQVDLETGVAMLMEAVEDKENYDSCQLTSDEKIVLDNLLKKLNLQ